MLKSNMRGKSSVHSTSIIASWCDEARVAVNEARAAVTSEICFFKVSAVIRQSWVQTLQKAYKKRKGKKK